jgi:hypothetical protein
MFHYRPAGQDIYASQSIAELEPFKSVKRNPSLIQPALNDFSGSTPVLVSSSRGWVAGADRVVEVYDTTRGKLMHVQGCGKFFINEDNGEIGKVNQQVEFTDLDREILIGPVLVLALAIRGVWCLHASAAMFRERVMVFLGESGRGKSTLARYLARNKEWQLIADDILPVRMGRGEVCVHPGFPQLKYTKDTQPGSSLPDQLSMNMICDLDQGDPDQMPALQPLSFSRAVQVLLWNTAGTRMFNSQLLSKHLDFSTTAMELLSAFKLIYPHRENALEETRKILEKIC